MRPGYLLSVRLITFNHESYVAQAIDSVFMQKTNFKIELVVGDDFSKDNTIRIINSYDSKNNVEIRVLKRKIGGEYWLKRNKIGRIYNFYNTISQCNGKYIALLDGDDYWTDHSKLQKQVDFLERNSKYSLCFHNALKVYQDEEKEDELFRYYTKTDYTQRDIIHEWLIPTASVVFRNVFLKKKPPNYLYHQTVGDLPLFLYLGEFGKYRYINETMSVYRVISTGVVKSDLVSEKYYMMSKIMTRSLAEYYKPKFKLDFAIRIAFDNYCLSRFAARNGERKKAISFLIKSIQIDPLMMIRDRNKYKYITLGRLLPKIIRDIIRGR